MDQQLILPVRKLDAVVNATALVIGEMENLEWHHEGLFPTGGFLLWQEATRLLRVLTNLADEG